MKFEYLLKHVYGSKLSRRRAMGVAAWMGAAAGVAGDLAALGAPAFHIAGLKVSEGGTGDYFTAGNGGSVLRDNHRITVEDIEAALERRHVTAITPCDVVLLRTGWTHLVSSDPERSLMQEPGIYLREARYLAQFRPAIIGGDGWALEVLDRAVTQRNAFPLHLLLFVRHGIRIGEGIVTEELAEDRLFEFVYIVTPPNALGATAGNTPPAALGQPSG